jgi:glycosyltransferase involved in cell wall biosynthesis
VEALEPSTMVIRPKPGIWSRALGKLYSMRRGWGARNQIETAAAMRFRRAMARRPDGVFHIANMESQAQLLDEWDDAPRSLIGTVHHPKSTWTEERRNLLRRLRSAIVLWRLEMPFFESLIGPGRVRFVRHGVDTDFFSPASGEPANPRRLIYIGQFLRNTGMLARVARLLREKNADLQIDLVVPKHATKAEGIAALSGTPGVRLWHGLSDEELRDRMRQAYLLLLPLDDSGANNAVVEAMSCGLPVVTTEVGGISDYGGGEIYPTVANNDDEGMARLTQRFLDDRAWRDEVSGRCREFAVRHLAWEKTAREHLQAYAELAAER